jgi:eukaryotic-like serine/threonine-protein kinase
MRSSSSTRLLLFAIAFASPVPLALAQDAGVRAEASAAAPLAGATPSPTSTTPHFDGEGEEPPEHPSTPAPVPKQPPVVRQATVVKDGMVRISGGRFAMGSDDKKAPPNERPSRIVVVSPFWIDKTEVTVGAYRACVDRGACPRPSRSSASCTYDLGDPMLPINCVPWTSAQTYCTATNKRLPREVEWEMAARGTSPIKYPWGGATAAGCGAAVTLASDGTQRSCGGKKPARVGSHPAGASPYGVHDMSGNVEEWVSDWYGEAVSDLSPRAGASHVLRGGGWLSQPSQSKATSRNWGSAREMGPNVGFRCARDD